MVDATKVRQVLGITKYQVKDFTILYIVPSTLRFWAYYFNAVNQLFTIKLASKNKIKKIYSRPALEAFSHIWAISKSK